MLDLCNGLLHTEWEANEEGMTMYDFEQALLNEIVDRYAERINKDTPFMDAFTTLDQMTVAIGAHWPTEKYVHILQQAINLFEQKLLKKGLRKFW